LVRFPTLLNMFWMGTVIVCI